jgi:hypothetical protein
MKNLLSYFTIASLIFSLAFQFTACGPAMDELPWELIDQDEDKGPGEGFNYADVETSTLEGNLLSAMPLLLNYAPHKYQYQRANSIDVYAGYFTVSNSAFQYGGPLPYTYSYPNPYIEGSLGESRPLYPLLYAAYHYGDNEKHNLPEWKALAQIMYAYSMHQLVDFFGVMAYHDYRAQKITPPLTYQTGRECYELILTDLDEAITTLKNRKPTVEALKRVEGVVGGYSNLQWQNWVRFANSIRLRMALNMVKADPAWARTVAEQAVNDEIGLITEDFGYPIIENAQHPLYMISTIWNDSRLGASLENILKRYQNPLLEKWFDKNPHAIRAKSGGALMLNPRREYVGIRQGVQMYPNSGNTAGYGAFSAFRNQFMTRTYFKVAEVLFLKAEGALRGWNMGGTAKTFYEQGIQQAFNDYAVQGFEEYMQRETVEHIDYEDYYVPEFGIQGRVTVGVKWNEEDHQEIKLEKIITQKYIANFPMGAEAWTTFRRTGYPRLFPVPERYKWTYDNSFDVELQIRRLPFSEQTETDRLNVSYVEQALGDRNAAGTRVWWDIATEGRDPEGKIVPVNF